MAYSFEQLKQAYKNLGVEKDKIVLVSGNLSYLMEFETPGKKEVLEAHFRALMELLGEEGTLVVPTGNASTNSKIQLCNTDICFSLKDTPSGMGVFSEYVRKKPGALRSFHPFVSYAAIGKYAKKICDDVSRHAFGPETPMERMINLDTLGISPGLHPRITTSIIHHIEMVMGVPYRYVKEFIHPVIRDGDVVREPFYMNVWYRECDHQSDEKKKIFKKFLLKYTVNSEQVGEGDIYSYSLADFYKFTVQLLKEDIYIWLKEIPKVKPYRN
jgi:aminoglycoside 3-N-acetyltransferase